MKRVSIDGMTNPILDVLGPELEGLDRAINKARAPGESLRSTLAKKARERRNTILERPSDQRAKPTKPLPVEPLRTKRKLDLGSSHK